MCQKKRIFSLGMLLTMLIKTDTITSISELSDMREAGRVFPRPPDTMRISFAAPSRLISYPVRSWTGSAPASLRMAPAKAPWEPSRKKGRVIPHG